MSTRTTTTYDDATTSPRTDTATDHTDDFSTPSEDPRATTDASPAPHDGTSWTDQCKRQFATTATTRMQNLNDEQNQAMHDGV